MFDYLVRTFTNLVVLKQIIRSFSLILAVLSIHLAWGQKKIITPEAYASWKSNGETTLSTNGDFVTYTIKPYQGDGFIYFENLLTHRKDSVARGQNAKLSSNSKFAVFKISPGYDTLRKAELKNKKSDTWPKDTLAVWNFENNSVYKFGKIKNFELAENGTTLAYLGVENKFPKNYLTKKEEKKLVKLNKKKPEPKSDGKLLTITPLETTEFKCFKNVTSYTISKSGKYVAFIQQEKHKKDSVRLNVFDVETNKIWQSTKQYLEIEQLNFSSKNESLLGLYTLDTASNKRWALFELNIPNEQFTILIDTNQIFDDNQVLSKNFKPLTKNNDQEIYFGVCAMPDKPVKDTLLEREKVKIDIWSWQDDRIQPQQLNELNRDLVKNNLTVFFRNSNKFVVLGRDSLRVQFNSKINQHYLLASCDESFRFKNWQYPNLTNYYIIRISDGKVIPEYQAQTTSVNLSPTQNYLCFWNAADQTYYLRDRNSEKEFCVTCGTDQQLSEDINGMIYQPQPLGIIGWSGKDEFLLIAAEKAILLYDVAQKKLINFTKRLQKDELDTNYTYQFHQLDSDSISFYLENCVLVQTNKTTRDESVFQLSGTFANPVFKLVDYSAHTYNGFEKAKLSDRIIFRKSSVKDYPNLFTYKDNLITQLTNANPQQHQYNWATVEVVNWKTYSGLQLEGLLYKPENYDQNTKYPLLVYYYELNSESLHRHYAPRPTASIIHPTEYASAGYLVFIPDIRYTAGHPANGAYDCIMSGVDAVLKKYNNIDSKRMGLQGQSWGGYQTAQLITMTNRFACAMAGAPVSNMFSAYGGIRWGSGYSRQFQYEHSQSRIGKTIWQAPELYVENSPLFGLPKVTTPLLIMHNDDDGAVPWYQSIELYMGLRRLQKPVWLLNYNGDEHNLMKPANRMDLSIRMRQFFDFYLLEEAEPKWMKIGIPAIDKGKKMNYELEE